MTTIEEVENAFNVIISEMKEMRTELNPSMQKDIDTAIESMLYLKDSMINLKKLRDAKNVKGYRAC